MRKTSSGISRHVRWVWVIGITLLIVSRRHLHRPHLQNLTLLQIICCAVGFGVYSSHKNSGQSSGSVVTAIGGSANEAGSGNTVTAEEKAGATTFIGVTPTRTVQRRTEPTGIPVIIDSDEPVYPDPDVDGLPYNSTKRSLHASRELPPLHRRHKRSYVNRNSLD